MPATATAPAPPPADTAYPRLPFGLFLGLRYLKPRRTFVSVITLISVLGVTLGIAVLIVVISVMTGYDTELRSKVLGFDPHIMVANQGLISDWRTVRGQIEGTPGVVAAAPYVIGPVLAEYNSKRIAPKIRAVEPSLEEKVIDIKGLMGKGSAGAFDLNGDKAVVGADLARLLGLRVGSQLTIYSPKNLEALTSELNKLEGKPADKEKIDELRGMVAPITLEVTGIFNSGRYLYDSEFIFVPLHIGQELYEMGGRVHGLAVRTTDAYHADRVGRALDEKFLRAYEDAARAEAAVTPIPEPISTPTAAPEPAAAPEGSPAASSAQETEGSPILTPADDDPGLLIPHAQTWMELNAQFFDAVRTERATMFVILFVVLIVAAFCVMNTLITVTVQKTREIGIMKAVGADVWQIVRVFASQGIVVGAFGMVTGLGLGLGILAGLNPFKRAMERFFGIEVFSRQVYGFGSIPYQTRPLDVAVICLGAFLICSLAALIPAYLAARMDPVKALRSE